ncbi:MAG: PorT family protein [Chitinophagaceae bacterium]|nr:PorT family protein [Chitinophagaceae bacterium]
MKQNPALFIRRMLPLVSIVTLAFLLQSCLCKQCLSGGVQRKSDPDVRQVYSENERKLPTAEAPQPEIVSPAIVYSLKDIPEVIPTSVAQDNATNQPQITYENHFSLALDSEKDIALQQVNTITRKINDIDIEKIIPAKPAIGKSCPLGIRSISSQIIAGPNISFKSSKEGDDVYGNNGHKHEPGAGFQVGMGSNLVFSEKFSVSPSLLLKQNNASEKITYQSYEPGNPRGGSAGETKDKYSYTYLSAPVVANYNVGKQVQVFAGPELNYLLRASVKTEGSTGGNGKENITKNSVKLGVGLQAGIKYQIPSGDGDSPFGVQLLYEHRLSRLNKKNQDGYATYDSPAWNMKGFQLGVTCSICNLMKGK